MDEKRYRLRKGDKIVGYMRKIGGRTVFYSRDSAWWTGSKLEYDQIDECIDWKDRKRNHIYEWDIVKCKLDPEDDEDKDGVVLWEKKTRSFGIHILQDEVFVPLEVRGLKMFNERQILVYSYLFINPDLMSRLGLSDE